MKAGIKIALSLALASSLSFAGEAFAMSDSDRAMYEEMLENNPADIMVESGNELLEELVGGPPSGVAPRISQCRLSARSD